MAGGAGIACMRAFPGAAGVCPVTEQAVVTRGKIEHVGPLGAGDVHVTDLAIVIGVRLPVKIAFRLDGAGSQALALSFVAVVVYATGVACVRARNDINTLLVFNFLFNFLAGVYAVAKQIVITKGTHRQVSPLGTGCGHVTDLAGILSAFLSVVKGLFFDDTSFQTRALVFVTKLVFVTGVAGMTEAGDGNAAGFPCAIHLGAPVCSSTEQAVIARRIHRQIGPGQCMFGCITDLAGVGPVDGSMVKGLSIDQAGLGRLSQAAEGQHESQAKSNNENGF
jgi:hypothetical protein